MAGNVSAFLESLNLTLIFLAFVVLGIIFSAIALIIGDHGAHADVGGIDVGVGDGDGGHGGCFLTPTALAFFSTSFGAYGLIFFVGFKTGPLMSVVLSTVLAAITMAGLNHMFFRLFVKTGSVVSEDKVEGLVGEVFTAIPADGVGEVLYRSDRGRQKAMARTIDGAPLASGETVVIKSSTGATLVVERQAPDRRAK